MKDSGCCNEDSAYDFKFKICTFQSGIEIPIQSVLDSGVEAGPEVALQEFTINNETDYIYGEIRGEIMI